MSNSVSHVMCEKICSVFFNMKKNFFCQFNFLKNFFLLFFFSCFIPIYWIWRWRRSYDKNRKSHKSISCIVVPLSAKKNWCRVDPVFADYFMNDFCITRIAGGDRRFICLVNCSKNRFFDENMIFWTVDCVWLKKIIFHDVKSGSYCPLAPLFFRKLCFTVRHSPKSYNYTV